MVQHYDLVPIECGSGKEGVLDPRTEAEFDLKTEREEEEEETEERTGVPLNTYRSVKFLSFEDEADGTTTVQRMRHFTDYVITIELDNALLEEGHVWGMATVTAHGCVVGGENCLQLLENSISKLSFRYILLFHPSSYNLFRS